MANDRDDKLSPKHQPGGPTGNPPASDENFGELLSKAKELVAQLEEMAPLIKDIKDRHEIRNEEDLERFMQEGEAAMRFVLQALEDMQREPGRPRNLDQDQS